MNLLAVTHFNNLTYSENIRWCKNKEYEGCLSVCRGMEIFFVELNKYGYKD